jgi:hypothetical protein
MAPVYFVERLMVFLILTIRYIPIHPAHPGLSRPFRSTPPPPLNLNTSQSIPPILVNRTHTTHIGTPVLS